MRTISSLALALALAASSPRLASAQAAPPGAPLDLDRTRQRAIPDYAPITGLDAIPWSTPSEKRPMGALLLAHFRPDRKSVV